MNAQVKKDLSIIVPTYNERENIKVLIPRIHKMLNNYNIDYEIIIVDDDSPDGTAKIAEALSRKYPVKIIKRENERGLYSAIVEGAKHATSNIVVVMDADLQHPPELIPKMYFWIKKGYDLVIASRYIRGATIDGWNPVRRLISWGARALAYALVPRLKNIKDIESGYFITHRSSILKLNTNEKSWKIIIDIVLSDNTKYIFEIPYRFGKRAHGKSKLTLRVIKSYIWHVIRLACKRGRLRRFSSIIWHLYLTYKRRELR